MSNIVAVAPGVDFEGQQITFSDFAARMSHRTQAPSVFAVPYWGQSGFEFELRELPFPYENEDIELFCLRWRSAFLLSMKEFLVKRPENARLSGGVWRHIK